MNQSVSFTYKVLPSNLEKYTLIVNPNVGITLIVQYNLQEIDNELILLLKERITSIDAYYNIIDILKSIINKPKSKKRIRDENDNTIIWSSLSFNKRIKSPYILDTGGLTYEGKTFMDLPPDVLHVIAETVDMLTLSRMEQISKTFRTVIKNQGLWCDLFWRDFPNISFQINPKPLYVMPDYIKDFVLTYSVNENPNLWKAFYEYHYSLLVRHDFVLEPLMNYHKYDSINVYNNNVYISNKSFKKTIVGNLDELIINSNKPIGFNNDKTLRVDITFRDIDRYGFGVSRKYIIKYDGLNKNFYIWQIDNTGDIINYNKVKEPNIEDENLDYEEVYVYIMNDYFLVDYDTAYLKVFKINDRNLEITKIDEFAMDGVSSYNSLYMMMVTHDNVFYHIGDKIYIHRFGGMEKLKNEGYEYFVVYLENDKIVIQARKDEERSIFYMYYDDLTKYHTTNINDVTRIKYGSNYLQTNFDNDNVNLYNTKTGTIRLLPRANGYRNKYIVTVFGFIILAHKPNGKTMLYWLKPNNLRLVSTCISCGMNPGRFYYENDKEIMYCSKECLP